MQQVSTADLSDQFPDVAVLAPLFRDYGGRSQFFGEVVTIDTLEDNSKVREILETAGAGRVLVVQGGGSTRCALLGDQLGELAVKNGWSGIIIHGCVRDTDQLKKLPVGIKAIASCPKKSQKLGRGIVNVPVQIGGLTIAPGRYVYADSDGVLVSERPLS